MGRSLLERLVKDLEIRIPLISISFDVGSPTVSSVPTNCVICGGEDSKSLFEKNGYYVVRCNSDGHMYVTPQPTLKELSALYSKEYFEGTSGNGYHHNVFEEKEKHLKRAKRRVKMLKRFVEGGKVLDVGCGPGFFVAAASDSFGIAGCDLSTVAANYAKKEFGLDIWVGDFLDFPDNLGPYDIITMFSYLEHTINPRKNLEKVRNILVPNGTLVLALPNINGIPRYLKGKYWRGFSIPEHLHFFSEDNLRRLLQETGFSLLKSRYTENNVFRDTNYFYARRL